MYSEQVLDHFQHPRNSGELAGADADAEVQNPACGDLLRLTARMQDGRVVEVRFRARGCVASIAAGSAVTEMVQGCTVQEARSLKREALLERLGGLPNESQHATYLAMDAVKALLKNF